MGNETAHFASVAPCFSVADISATIVWYEQLGFEADPFPEHEPYVFAILRRDAIEIMLQRLKGYVKPELYSRRDGGVWDAYFQVKGVKEFYDSINDRLTIVKHLRRQPYGAWEFEVKDPNGYILVFSEV